MPVKCRACPISATGNPKCLIVLAISATYVGTIWLNCRDIELGSFATNGQCDLAQTKFNTGPYAESFGVEIPWVYVRQTLLSTTT